MFWEGKGWLADAGHISWRHMECAQHAAHNPKFEKMIHIRCSRWEYMYSRLKDPPPTWLKVTTTIEKYTPPPPTWLKVTTTIEKYPPPPPPPIVRKDNDYMAAYMYFWNFHGSQCPIKAINSLAPERPRCHFKTAIFNLVLLIGIFTSSKDHALRRMPRDLTDDKWVSEWLNLTAFLGTADSELRW